ncbi:MAG: hypothetical protein LBE33_01730 [Zoogloeaceae bacterium]|jgi:transposase InsO family protein|nr:hypothetical protein [Zoogloeaceae bacterium]
MRRALKEFIWFYNEIRVHQNLGELTPMEAWQGKTIADVRRLQDEQPGQWSSALNGLLVGYRVRC